MSQSSHWLISNAFILFYRLLLYILVYIIRFFSLLSLFLYFAVFRLVQVFLPVSVFLLVLVFRLVWVFCRVPVFRRDFETLISHEGFCICLLAKCCYNNNVKHKSVVFLSTNCCPCGMMVQNWAWKFDRGNFSARETNRFQRAYRGMQMF